ncbi:hypothetical protein ACP87_01295 [Pseudomonas oleovorans]|uniref:Uncharacterized protein n=1 Tax=Ectopseudomonas oleovorans TaxID=301 RepID=A0A3R9CJU7_ECTOL|nr:hypothetical protein [Pseudomonas oleovorans]MBN7132765.1 hypothetical protein [Pseudomonas oleovorans]MBN7140117.1 hypothetical protein [Pseudomonas oleovorans]RRW26087.1 hypothetical protein EGJ44_22255 [Pseudomonas oleovorans]
MMALQHDITSNCLVEPCQAAAYPDKSQLNAADCACLNACDFLLMGWNHRGRCDTKPYRKGFQDTAEPYLLC